MYVCVCVSVLARIGVLGCAKINVGSAHIICVYGKKNAKGVF